MVQTLLAVIVALCAFASPSLADPNIARPHLMEGRSSIDSRSDKDDNVFSRAGRNAVAIAERYLGTNPTKMRRLWCANFMGMIEKKAGRKGTGSNMARSYVNYGKKVSKPQPGDIAVLSRGKRGGHVGYFVGWAPNGKAILISGNSRGGKVSKGRYSTSRVIAWRRPG